VTTTLLSRSDLAAELDRQRAAGKRIVLCNGVFDLLHVGHTRLLSAARAQGDLLVVALNDDASASDHKQRPLQSAHDRAEILAAFSAVDFVCLFSEATVANTLRTLKPHMHAKGEDYRPEDLPAEERAAAEECGIELVLLGGPKVASSSDLSARQEKRS